MAKYKSINDMDSQYRRIQKLADETGNSALAKKAKEILERYKGNIRKSKYAKKLDEQWGKAIEKDIANGNYTSSYDAGDGYSVAPSTYDYESTIDHSGFDRKLKKYHFTRSVYQDGNAEDSTRAAKREAFNKKFRTAAVGATKG